MAIFVPCNQLIVQASTLLRQPRSVVTLSDTGDSNEEGDSGSNGNSGGQSGTTGTSEPTPETTFDGFAISESVISDRNLYDALLSLYKSKDPNYNGSTLYSDMFNSELFTEINVDRKNISSLKGLEKLDLFYLESFSANLNSIETFDEDVFVNTDINKFRSISLASNLISSIEITTPLRLTELNLDCNELTKIDLSKIEAEVDGTPFSLSIANNKIANMSDIVLPSKRIGHITLNLINNQLKEIDDGYFTDKYTLNLGVQGFKLVEEELCVNTKSNVLIYKTNNPNLRVDIYRIDGESDQLIESVQDTDITEKFKKLNLSVGQYEYRYMLIAENEGAYDKYDIDRVYLVSNRFNVIPQTVTYIYTYKGKDYQTLNKVTGEVTVKLSCEEGATIMYQVNGGEWITGDVVECNKGGTYSIKAKAVMGEFESEVENIFVRTSLNLYIPDGLMLVFVLLIALVLFLVVLPIVSRKYFKRD